MVGKASRLLPTEHSLADTFVIFLTVITRIALNIFYSTCKIDCQISSVKVLWAQYTKCTLKSTAKASTLDSLRLDTLRYQNHFSTPERYDKSPSFFYGSSQPPPGIYWVENFIFIALIIRQVNVKVHSPGLVF